MFFGLNNREATSNTNTNSNLTTVINPSEPNTRNNFADNLLSNTADNNVSIMHAANNMNVYAMQDQDLITRLSRPVVLEQGYWLATEKQVPDFMEADTFKAYMADSANFFDSAIAGFDFPNDLLKNSQFLVNCLTNVAYMRADIVVNVRVQADPYTQGSLWLMQEPVPLSTSKFRRDLCNFRAPVTSFPGVELNLLSPTREISLTVPYTSEFSYCRFDDPETAALGSNTFASVKLYVLLPLRSATSPKVPYTITANLTNIKLYGLQPNTFDLTIARRVNGYQAQGEEEAVASSGKISSISSTVSSVAALAGNIPSLSSIAKPIQWAADAVTGIASYFGMSKPSNVATTHTFAAVPAKGFTNVEGVDNSVKLSALPNNQIATTDVAYDNQDAMTIDYIARRPFLNTRYVYSSEAEDGSFLGSYTYHPSAVRNFGSTLSGTEEFVNPSNTMFIFGPPIAMVSNFFRFWRGTMCLRIKFAKTQFHNGRILIQYLPYNNDSTGDFSVPLESAQSVIIDISSVDEDGYLIKFPMIASNKWLEVGSPQTTAKQEGNPTECAGVVTMTIFNKLTHPATVSKTVDIYAWTHWEDFELAYPTSEIRFPYFKHSPSLVDYTIPPGVVEQVGSGNSGDPSRLTTTMGEALVSLRALTRRFTAIGLSTFTDTTTCYPLNPVPDFSHTTQSLFDQISMIYRFFHGSQRYKFIMARNTEEPYLGAALDPNIFYTNTTTNGGRRPFSKKGYEDLIERGSPFTALLPQVNNIIEAEIPYYTPSENLCCGGYPEPSGDAYQLNRPGIVLSESARVALTAAGDDFSFDYLVGCPFFSNRTFVLEYT